MTGVFGEGRHFHATLPERIGDSKVQVDGVDISRVTRGFTFRTEEAGRFASVEIDLNLIEAGELNSERTRVVLSADCEELLRAGGWLGPTEAHALNHVLETARAWMSGHAHAVDLQIAIEAVAGG